MSSLLEDDTRYVKLWLLLVKGGTYVFKKHTQQILDNDNTTIDVCLKKHRDKLSKVKQIYPKLWELLSSNSKDIDDLDISAHAYILLNIFDKKLNAVEKVVLTKLRNKRNVLGHPDDGPLPEDVFLGEWSQLNKVLYQLSSGLSSNDQDYVDTLIGDISAIKHLDKATDELKPFGNQDGIVKDVLAKLQCSNERRLDELHQRLCELEKFKQNIESRQLELLVRITAISSTQTASDAAYRQLLEAIKHYLAGGHVNQEGDEVSTVVNNILTDMSKDGASIKKVEEGSVLIIFSCSTLTSLKSAFLYLTKTVYIQRLQELERALSQSADCCVKLNVNIILESLISTLDKEENCTSDKSVVLTVSCMGSKGVRSVCNNLINESSLKTVNNMAEALSTSVGQRIELHTSIDFDKLENKISLLERLHGYHDVQRSLSTLGSAYLVTNFDSSSYDTHDSVYNLIAAQVKHKPCRLQYGSRDDEFVVEFGENVPPGALDSLKATVKPIEPTKEVQFIGESGDTIDKHDISDELHSDDDLGEVKVRTVGEHIWIVTFKTEEAARCVWTENERVIVNTKVTVLPYYQAIGVSHTKGRKPTRIIESRSIENLDEEKLKFVTGNQDEEQKLTHYLEQKFRGELLWEQKDDDSISFDYNGFDQTWFEQLTTDLKHYFDEFKITTTSKDDDCKTDRSSEKVFEKNVIGKVVYLHGKGSIKDLLKRFPYSRLSIDQQKGIGKLIGPQVEIDELFIEIQKLMLNLDEREIQLSAPLADILKNPDCKNLLLKDMKDITNEDIMIISNTLRIWESAGGRISKKEMRTRKAEMIQRRIKEVFVDREKLDVEKEFYPTFQTEKWDLFKDTLTEKYRNVCIEVKSQHGEINMHLTTTKQLFEKIKLEIGEFLAVA